MPGASVRSAALLFLAFAAACKDERGPGGSVPGPRQLVMQVYEDDGTGTYQRDVYRMDEDGAGRVNLTNHRGDDRHPSFSPDGTKIVFSSNREGAGFHLWVMNADGTGMAPMTDLQTPADYRYPVWSPDGTRVA